MPYMTDGDIHILAAVTSGHTEMATTIIMFSYAQNIHSIHTTKVPQTHNHGVKTESGSNCLKRWVIPSPLMEKLESGRRLNFTDASNVSSIKDFIIYVESGRIWKQLEESFFFLKTLIKGWLIWSLYSPITSLLLSARLIHNKKERQKLALVVVVASGFIIYTFHLQ